MRSAGGRCQRSLSYPLALRVFASRCPRSFLPSAHFSSFRLQASQDPTNPLLTIWIKIMCLETSRASVEHPMTDLILSGLWHQLGLPSGRSTLSKMVRPTLPSHIPTSHSNLAQAPASVRSHLARFSSPLLYFLNCFSCTKIIALLSPYLPGLCVCVRAGTMSYLSLFCGHLAQACHIVDTQVFLHDIDLSTCPREK